MVQLWINEYLYKSIREMREMLENSDIFNNRIGMICTIVKL